MSPVVFSRGTGSDGTGLFKKVQSGSQPSLRFQTRSLSGGTVFLTLVVIILKNFKNILQLTLTYSMCSAYFSANFSLNWNLIFMHN